MLCWAISGNALTSTLDGPDFLIYLLSITTVSILPFQICCFHCLLKFTLHIFIHSLFIACKYAHYFIFASTDMLQFYEKEESTTVPSHKIPITHCSNRPQSIRMLNRLHQGTIYSSISIYLHSSSHTCRPNVCKPFIASRCNTPIRQHRHTQYKTRITLFVLRMHQCIDRLSHTISQFHGSTILINPMHTLAMNIRTHHWSRTQTQYLAHISIVERDLAHYQLKKANTYTKNLDDHL